MTQTSAAPQTRLPFVAGDDVLEFVEIEEAMTQTVQAQARPDADCGRPTIYEGSPASPAWRGRFADCTA
jgi:hypothetical protein